MIIDNSYFIGEIYLSQVGANASTKVNNNTNFQYFLDQYEREIIDMALGKQLADEFYLAIDPITGEWINTTDAKWNRLLNGHIYTKGNVDYYWQGLIRENGTFKSSLIAYYVYCKYVKADIIQKSTLGTIKTDAENAKSASVTPTYVNAWRKLFEWYGEGYYNDVFYHNSYYKKGVYVQDFFGDGNRDVTLYKFLKDNESDYDNWSFTAIENVNQFGV